MCYYYINVCVALVTLLLVDIFVGMCDGGQCVECETDAHCLPHQYCLYNNVPYVLNDCVDKLPNGHLCLQDRVSTQEATE